MVVNPTPANQRRQPARADTAKLGWSVSTILAALRGVQLDAQSLIKQGLHPHLTNRVFLGLDTYPAHPQSPGPRRPPISAPLTA